MSFLTKIFGDPTEKIIKEISPTVEKINSLEEKYSKMSDEELKAQTNVLKERLGDCATLSRPELDPKLNDILPDAFAVMREAARRVINQRHFDVQLVGGVVLHRGQIAEMKTGEGKTLVATLPLYLNALTGKGVQLVTVNDYLSRVGAGWMAPVFAFLGLTTGVIVNYNQYVYDLEYIEESQYDERLRHLKPSSRTDVYKCDVVYGTNNEFGFDYLRDNMVLDLDSKVQRGFYYSIVDEVDSILIDEARTPLIISGPAEESTDKYFKFSELVKRLKENEDYNVDEKLRAATLTDEGMQKIEDWLGVGNIYVEKGISEVHHIEQALRAQVLFKEGRDYVNKEGEIVIVDEFTGRMMPGRRYSEGLHQAIEAKEGVKVQRESQTLATVTFQNYFRMYEKLAGMTGTAATEAEEFSKIYKLEVISIPTNKPIGRKDLNDLVYRTELGKFRAVVADVKERHALGQPVLIGTISIEKNEILAEIMQREGLEPAVLNAKNHEKEARILSDAGRKGAITVATNMAGRGVDIILGGLQENDATPEQTEAWKKDHEEIISLGGLCVIGTERHESRRIDNQLRGRAGRQGDSGESRFYLSCEDDLMRIFGGDRLKGMMKTLQLPEDMPIENRLVTGSIETAQKKVEANNFDSRKQLLEYDDVVNKHRESIYRRRDEILAKAKNEKAKLKDLILLLVEEELNNVVSFHTSVDDVKDWNLKEIYEVANTIFPAANLLQEKLEEIVGEVKKIEKTGVRIKIIEHLVFLANEAYSRMEEKYLQAGIDWSDLEKNILLRSIDSLWVEHIDAMEYMRRGIGWQGYGQRDPLVEYKKEAFRMFTELNSMIQKEVVYGIFKFSAVEDLAASFIAPSIATRAQEFSAPSKTSESSSASNRVDAVHVHARDAAGEKVGRNDNCPCGSGKKYKKCCGR
ncbi:MAG: preprotein translocase subunit SecA [Patescibacteria group bacterium]|jgi:preprotein translocase subunit SecA